jgi:DNA-binding transcriptional LysR family regulator
VPRPDVNRSEEMEVFVRAVELGGLSPAARALRMTPSAVSKLVARLERRLGARLINRSTRKLLLTAEGQAFLERAHRVLADLDEAERSVTAGAVPRGLVRVNSPQPILKSGWTSRLPTGSSTSWTSGPTLQFALDRCGLRN